MNTLTTFTLVFTALSAALHCFIFVLETILWESEYARKTFGTTPAEAKATKELAANQGVYNLLLAVTSFAGIVAWILGNTQVGTALVLTGCGSMLFAATYLFTSAPDKRTTAMKQGFFPLVAVLCTLFYLFSAK